MATAQAHVIKVSQGSGVRAALCIRRTLCRHCDDWYSNGNFLLFDCLLTVVDCFWRMVHCTNRQKHSKPLVYQSSQVYQDCTNSVPTVYQSSKTVKRQSKQQKWPLVYQSSQVYQDCTNNRKKTVKTAKTPIVNKNLAIANRSRVSCAHNTSRAFIGLNITPWPWNLD